MIKIDLITGFLGSGKTTFLLQYGKYLMQQGLKIGILEYDYGALNVDMLLLNKLRGERCELEMVAAACDEDCLRRRFRTKLISMAMTGYDRVIVEPSGVFDMDLFFDTVRDETLENWYEIGSVITIVNANLRLDLGEEESFFLASQAAGAGCILFSRVQLSTPERIAQTKEYVEEAARKIQCEPLRGTFLAKNWEELQPEDFELLSSCGYHLSDYRKVIAGTKSDFSSLCFLDLPDDLDGMQKKIQELFGSDTYGEIIRVKGFVCDAHRGGCQINATRYEMLIDPLSIGQGAMVVIGRNLRAERIRELMART
ncbi:MAG: GTPase (G3E family) [Lachnospiraceae bacterium]|nr:GTPase (G3E family) [Lachnospiraceae bacterium]